MIRTFESYCRLREAGNDTTAYVPTQASSAQMNVPAATPPDGNLSWQLRMFRGWYDTHRGRWAEVEQAARREPRIYQFLSQAAKQLTAQRQPVQPDEDGGFDTEAGTVQGHVADRLEDMVRAVIPGHGHAGDWRLPSVQAVPVSRVPSPAAQAPSPTDSNPLLTQLWHRHHALERRVDDLAQRVSSVG